MEKIYYDSYEKRIRTTVWAEKISDGSVKIHKYVRGIYVDDIGGLDETDTVLTVHEESLQKLFSEAHVPSVKDLFVFFTQFACCREGYEHIRSWIDHAVTEYEEETV